MVISEAYSTYSTKPVGRSEHSVAQNRVHSLTHPTWVPRALAHEAAFPKLHAQKTRQSDNREDYDISRKGHAADHIRTLVAKQIIKRHMAAIFPPALNHQEF